MRKKNSDIFLFFAGERNPDRFEEKKQGPREMLSLCIQTQRETKQNTQLWLAMETPGDTAARAKLSSNVGMKIQYRQSECDLSRLQRALDTSTSCPLLFCGKTSCLQDPGIYILHRLAPRRPGYFFSLDTMYQDILLVSTQGSKGHAHNVPRKGKTSISFSAATDEHLQKPKLPQANFPLDT